MTTLVEFLLARIAEDEERFAASPHDVSASASADLNEGYIVGLHERLRAECEAKRRIVERLRWTEDHLDDGPTDLASWPGDRATLADLAVPYADHPDYREEWRP